MPTSSNQVATLHKGAYVDLDHLLALRFQAMPERRRRRQVARFHGGTRVSKLRGRGIDFAEVRLYQPGDDIRSIDWRVTARKNKPHTKVFREERERPSLVIVDQTQSLFFGSRVRLKSVVAAEIGALAGWHALAGDDRVGGVVLGNRDVRVHKPRKSARHYARFLADLAEENHALNRDTAASPANNHLIDGLQQVVRLAHTNHRLFIVSDFAGVMDDMAPLLARLARHNQVHAVHVYDQLERTLPPPGEYSVTDNHTRAQFHSGNSELRAAYELKFQNHVTTLERQCLSLGMQFSSLATDDPLSNLGAW